MKAISTWRQGMQFVNVADSGHPVMTDAGVDAGGEGAAAKPVELILMGLASCSGIDMVIILNKMRLELETLAVEADSDRSPVEPKRFTAIRLLFRVTGSGIKPAAVERAVRLSLEKYCSVAASLNADLTFACEVNGERFPAEGYMA